MIHKLKTYYNKLQEPVKASLWFLICGFLQRGISMLTMPIFTRVMTEAEYGRFSVYNSWFSILQIIVSLNLAAGVYTRGLVKNEDDEDRFSSSMLGLSTTCVLIWSVIYILFHKVINSWVDLSTILMSAMLIEIWAHAVFQFWSNKERVHYRYKKLVALTLVYVTLRPVLGVIFVTMVAENHQVEARVITAVVVSVILFTMLFFSIMKKGRQYFNKKYWIYALKFNLPLVPHYLSQIVLNQSDRLMINYFCGAVETAYYNVAYTLAMVLQMLNTSISGTMNPWIYKSIKNKEINKIGTVSYYVLGLIAVSNFIVVAVAPEILRILAPVSYQAAVWVIPPVTVSVFFMFLYNLFATFEYYFEKTYFVTVATIIGAILNIILNAIFIPKFGFVAAGYTTLVCYILYAFAHYGFMRIVNKKCMEGIVVYKASIIILIGVILLISSAIIMLFYKMPIVRYTIVFILFIIALLKRKQLRNIIKNINMK